jgi:hypothetical protein
MEYMFDCLFSLICTTCMCCKLKCYILVEKCTQNLILLIIYALEGFFAVISTKLIIVDPIVAGD